MNEQGIQNAIDIAHDYYNITITEQWLKDNLDKIASYFPAADDEWYLEEYGDSDIHWTFQAECENGSIFDTAPREAFAEALAQILTGGGWPIYADPDEVSREFYQILAKTCEEQEGIEFAD